MLAGLMTDYKNILIWQFHAGMSDVPTCPIYFYFSGSCHSYVSTVKSIEQTQKQNQPTKQK